VRKSAELQMAVTRNVNASTNANRLKTRTTITSRRKRQQQRVQQQKRGQPKVFIQAHHGLSRRQQVQWR